LSLRRVPDPSRRSRRLVVCGVSAALLIVPGVASAGDTLPPANPLTAVTEQVEGVTQDTADALTGGQRTAAVPEIEPGTETGSRTETADGATTPAVPSLDATQLQPLLTALHVSPDCAPAIAADLQAILASIPATLEQLIATIGGQLTTPPTDLGQAAESLTTALTQLADGEGGDDVAPTGLPLVPALQKLGQDFLDLCLPQTAPGAAAPSPTGTAPAVATSPAPAPAAAPAAAAPVAYLGYAPTGAPAEDPGDGRPLALLGGVLLLAGGAVGSWMRSRRAASSRR
jgi:hypothetical protein